MYNMRSFYFVTNSFAHLELFGERGHETSATLSKVNGPCPGTNTSNGGVTFEYSNIDITLLSPLSFPLTPQRAIRLKTNIRSDIEQIRVFRYSCDIEIKSFTY